MKPDHILYPHVLVILEKLPLELGKKINTLQVDSGGGSIPTEKSLVQLHKEVGKFI